MRLTVCICAYNAEKYLLETLTSLEQQTFSDFDWLFIDDASSDGTVQLFQQWIADHPERQAELIQLSQNSGTAVVRQLALEHVRTPLMMFFDADDIAKSNLVKTLYDRIVDDDDLIAVSCYCSYMDANGKVLNGGLYLGPTSREEFVNRAEAGKMMFILPPTIFRREYALKAGGYRQKDWFPSGKIRYEDLSEDVDLWGRMSDFYADGKCILTIPEELYHYRKNTNSLSTGFAKSRAMGQKLMYIKVNLKRRRDGLPELKFNEFWSGLSRWRRLNFERRNLGAYLYRQACFAWVQRRLLACGWNLLFATLCSPLYLLEKYHANFRGKK